MTTDVVLNQDKGYWDFNWTSTGDISTAQSLDTYLLMLILEERRASEAEIPEPNQRRGWVGNESLEFEQGSFGWLFSQERVQVTGSMLAEYGTVIENALQRAVSDNIATRVIVETPFLSRGEVSFFIQVFHDSSPTERLFFQPWANTPNQVTT